MEKELKMKKKAFLMRFETYSNLWCNEKFLWVGLTLCLINSVKSIKFSHRSYSMSSHRFLAQITTLSMHSIL